jgi:hypothetical protein
MNKTDELLIAAWKKYIRENIEENKDSSEICKKQIKNWALSKLTKSYCNPEILLLVLQEIESC